ncbi:PadR family transcriptional regulator [Streptococcus gallolyticus]|uniref:PadR family transcriptional regulator n=1 Tax=Streptococcus hepaticus TaxID=3349163 RepID=UPI001C947CF8|nr:PadR family transcriptional regulator [Streptococcus gallolyticus]MBY5041719.1 PadR family transcriptional regulator [Streptococcus gallolyticus]
MPRERILPHIILGIMSSNDGEMLGKDIIAFFNREIGEFWQVAHSQVYPELKRMTAEGFLTCHGLPDNDKEKLYRLTEKGQEQLESWLAIPNQETPKQRDIFSLKMFFIQKMDDERIPMLLQGQIDILEAHLAHMEERKATLFAEQATIKNNYGHYLILRRAIARNKSQLEWLREVLEEVLAG